MPAASPRFMFVFRETTPERYEAMSQGELRACLARWNGWCDELARRGTLLDGHPLLPEARVVSSARGTDGPFTEAKELIGGFFILDAADLDEALEIARGCPNLPYGMEVEVRPVACGCHLARALGMTSMREPAGA